MINIYVYCGNGCFYGDIFCKVIYVVDINVVNNEM